MASFKRKDQERDGTYTFSGALYATVGITRALSGEEIASVIADLFQFVAECDGGDYLQVYEADDGRVVWCIDNLSRRMKESSEFTAEQLAEDDYWTMLLPSEY